MLYYTHTLAKQEQEMKLPNPVKQRNHYVLFAANSPFKPKTVGNKKAYKRVSKHRVKDY